MRLSRILLPLLLASAPLLAGEFRAGAARIDITPKSPIWMSGYANRNHPSEGVLEPLWAKALAIEDSKNNRVVIVTTDLIGLPRAITDVVAARALKQFDLDRARLLFNSSHTHTGPLVRYNLTGMFHLSEADQQTVDAYGTELTGNLLAVIGAALAKLQPAQISFAMGSVGFAVNRREPGPKGIKIGVNPAGPVDHTVPLIKVTGSSGSLIAVLFGYACHNTTLTGQFYQLSGDYAGFAQIDIEKAHPNTVAMFLMLCGGDQNPNPRSKIELAQQHGQTLAAEVERLLAGPQTPLKPPTKAAYTNIELEFARHDYDQRNPVHRVPYPIQAIRFDNSLTILALGGEVVVDYALRAKQEFGAGPLIVAGYSNDVMSYIPSQRVLHEGGYEAVDSMVYYGQPGPYADDVEDRIFSGIHQVMHRVGGN